MEKEERGGVAPFYQHQWFDLLDDHGKWYEAVVQNVNQNNPAIIKVHYKGWASKYDEVLDTTKPEVRRRIKPLNSQTPGGKASLLSPIVGDKLDVLDTSNVWRSSVVLDRRVLAPPKAQQLEMIFVSYDGWSKEYDEWIPVDSYRFAPWHEHSRKGYKRQVKIRRNHETMDQRDLPPDRESSFRALLEGTNMRIVDQEADGNCLFRSVAHQVYGNSNLHELVRARCMDYIASARGFFSRFIDGEFDEYVHNMRRAGEWGDHVEIQAMSEIYERKIQILAYSLTPIQTYYAGTQSTQERRPLLLSYHFNSHYNSITRSSEHTPAILLPPGEQEDRRIAASIANSIARPHREESENEEMQLALQISRQSFATSSNLADYDQAVLASLGVGLSETSHVAQTVAVNDIEKAIMLSLTESSPPGPILDNVSDLQLALALSSSEIRSEGRQQNNDLTNNILATEQMDLSHDHRTGNEASSPGANPQLPPEILRFHTEMGFPLARVEKAYSIMGDDVNASNQQIVDNVTRYLLSSS